MRRLLILSTVVAVIVSINTASADDFNSPPWRGSERTTYSRWEFGDSTNPDTPDVFEQIPSTPTLTSSLCVYEGTYLGSDLGESGVWRLDDCIGITIQNFNEAYPFKEIWLQLTYLDPDGDPIVFAEVGENQFMGELVFKEEAGNYYHGRWEITIEPNPSEETIKIYPRGCTLYLDEVVVDTICVPEPATICLLGLGALALLRKRRA